MTISLGRMTQAPKRVEDLAHELKQQQLYAQTESGLRCSDVNSMIGRLTIDAYVVTSYTYTPGLRLGLALVLYCQR